MNEWKDELRRDLEVWLDSIDQMPDPAPEEPGEPDLYSFFEQLAVLGTEGRKGNRRAAEAFSQWSETLARFDSDLRLLRDQIGRLPQAESGDALPRRHCMALVELLDRLHRLAHAFESRPARARWWANDAAWRNAWDTQRDAFAILVGHFETLLSREGLTRIECLGRPFDPAVMAAVAVEPDDGRPDGTVLEEIAPGYFRRGELLRPAQVKVSLNRSGKAS